MTRIITYSLRLQARNSDEYYRSIAAFADRWLEEAIRNADVLQAVAAFRDYRELRGESERSEAEYVFELLALGVTLREHGGEAMRLPRELGWALQGLVRAQTRWPKAESLFKLGRGWVGWVGRQRLAGEAGRQDVDRLITWLRAQGESARADRLAQWQSYFKQIGDRPARAVISTALVFATDFAAASALALGRYTEGVDRFLVEVAPKYCRRYDAEFVSRSRVEYHLGMLGTEILSRASRLRFLSTRRRIVIVPPCMRAQPEDKCKAVATSLGARCQACTPACRIHQVTKLGEKKGFEVYMIPDELRVLGHGMGGGKVGVVGVSCALTNWSGGWEAEALSLPAQGVLLDYVGCQYHWDAVGIPTDVNIRELGEVATGMIFPPEGGQ